MVTRCHDVSDVAVCLHEGMRRYNSRLVLHYVRAINFLHIIYYQVKASL